VVCAHNPAGIVTLPRSPKWLVAGGWWLVDEGLRKNNLFFICVAGQLVTNALCGAQVVSG